MLEETQQNLNYHFVFSSILANYFNLKKDIDSGTNAKLAEHKKQEVISLLRSAYGYAIQLKRNAPENADIPKEPEKLVHYIDKRIEKLKKETSDYIEAFFFETAQKMEIAGLTPIAETVGNSYMDLIMSERDKK